MGVKSPDRSRTRDRKILVVGGGFLGRHVAAELSARAMNCRVLSRSIDAQKDLTEYTDIEIMRGDAAQRGTMTAAIADVTDVVWAINSLMPGESEQDPISDLTLMLQPLLQTLEILRDRPDISLTVLSSGGTVYGQPSAVPTPESARTEPLSTYGITRLVTEKFALRHATLTGATVRVARVANAYGPGQTSARGQGIVAAAFEHARSGLPLTVYGGGTMRRDFIHVADAAHYIVDYVVADDAPRILNIGSGSSTPIIDVIAMVRSISGLPLELTHLPARPFDVACVQLDVTLLSTISSWRCRRLSDGIEATWSATGTDRTRVASVG